MPNPAMTYAYTRGERGIFAEIYFPKKVVYQSAIFDALRDGYKPTEVKLYLRRHARALLKELADYKGLFNPQQYEEGGEQPAGPPTLEDARIRIRQYISRFKGWSMYEVDGVWVADDRIDEERVQVIRILFRLPSRYTKVAKNAGCSDVLRAIHYWTIASQGHVFEHRLWGEAEQGRFLHHHAPLPPHKEAFATHYYRGIATEVARWRDDCALFVFGYLVRCFAEKVLAERKRETEIWVTSFFNLTVNVIKRVEFVHQP